MTEPWHPDRVIEPRFAWRVAEAVTPTPELIDAGARLGLGGRAIGLLAGRGVRSAAELEAFFAEPITALHAPGRLPDALPFLDRVRAARHRRPIYRCQPGRQGGIAMSVEAKTESEQVVLRFFATLSAGDLEGVRRMLHEQATWTAQMHKVPGAGIHRGPKGIVDDFLVPIRAMFRPGDPQIIVDTIASRGSFVMVESHSGGCLADGRPYENLYAWAVEVRQGKIYALREYFDSQYVMDLMSTGPAK